MANTITDSPGPQTISAEATNAASVDSSAPAVAPPTVQPQTPQEDPQAAEKLAQGFRQYATENKSQHSMRGQLLQKTLASQVPSAAPKQILDASKHFAPGTPAPKQLLTADEHFAPNNPTLLSASTQSNTASPQTKTSGPTVGTLARNDHQKVEKPEVQGLQQSINKWRADNGEAPIQPNGIFGSETEQAVKEFQKANGLNPVDGRAGVATRERLSLETDPKFGKLSDPVKLQVRTAMNQLGKDATALQNLRHLATYPGFGGGTPSLSTDRQQEMIKMQTRFPEISGNLLKLAGSLSFHQLGGAQTDVLKRMEAAAGNSGKVDNLTNLVTAPGFAAISPSNQKLMLDALDQPNAGPLGKNFHDLTPVASSLSGLSEPTQREIVNRLIKHSSAGDSAKVKDLVDVVAYGDFDRLSPGHQKLMLDALANGAGNGGNLNLLAHSPGFQNMDPDAKTKLLNRVVSYKGDHVNIANLTNLVTTPGFDRLSPKTQNIMLDVQELRSKESHFPDPRVAPAMVKLVLHRQFLDSSENEQKEWIHEIVNNPGSSPYMTGQL